MQKTGYNKYYKLTNIGPYNRPIRYRSDIGVYQIGKSQKFQYWVNIGSVSDRYRIGIGSANYKGLYRLIGYLYYNKFFRHKKNLTYAKLVQIPD